MKFFKSILFIFLVSLASSSFGYIQKVQDVFIDVKSDYKYGNELQTFYDMGVITPDKNGKFNPTKLLSRDEFVGVVMEISCKNCVKPNTALEYITKYTGEKIFYDVSEKNKFFYCIAQAKATDVVKGYGNDYTCEDKTYKAGENPFCINNNITLEEALAVLLRNSAVFTIEDNNNIIAQIQAGSLKDNLAKDVGVKNIDGSVYTFYGYFKKALELNYEEYDIYGNKKNYHLAVVDANGNLNPKKYISKEEFLRMSYIVSKMNACGNREASINLGKIQMAGKINIYEKKCTNGDKNCYNIDVFDTSVDTYDFFANIHTSLPMKKYTWYFYNFNTGESIFKTGKYIDNFTFPSSGAWRIALIVEDQNGNTLQIENQVVYKAGQSGKIDIYEEKCRYGDESCYNIDNFDASIDTYDFFANIEASLPMKKYTWDFYNSDTGETISKTGKYIDNFTFPSSGTWNITLIVEDQNGNKMETEKQVIYNAGQSENGNQNGFVSNSNISSQGNSNMYHNISVSIQTNIISGQSPATVEFSTITHDCQQCTYNWSFGNGQTSTMKDINYTYMIPGIYKVELVVQDRYGNIGVASVMIEIRKNYDEIQTEIDRIANTYKIDMSDLKNLIGSSSIRDIHKKIDEIAAEHKNNSDLQKDLQLLKGSIGSDIGSGKVDSDLDGVYDNDDKCINIKGPAKNHGCPILEVTCEKFEKGDSCKSGYVCNADGICEVDRSLNNDLVGSCIYPSNGSSVFGNRVCDSCPCAYEIDFIASVRRCDIIIPAITSLDKKEIYGRGEPFQVPYEYK